jgi:hypothetical protein
MNLHYYMQLCGPLEPSVNRASMIVHELLECYNVPKEEQDEEDLRNI